MGNHTVQKYHKQIKQKRNSTILSLSLLILFGIGYFSYTFLDIDGYNSFIYGSRKTESDLVIDGGREKLNKGDSQNEIELNSLRVEEQISTIRNGMNLQSATRYTSTLIPNNYKPSAVQAPNDYNNGYIDADANDDANADANANAKKNKQNKINRGNDKNDSGFDAEANYKEIINTSRIVLFMKSSDPKSNSLKKLLLKDYEILPEIAIVDLDKHVKGELLQEYVAKKKVLNNNMGYHKDDSLEVPFLVINGIPVVTTSNKHDFQKLHEDGLLLAKLKNLAGDSVMISKKNVPSNS